MRRCLFKSPDFEHLLGHLVHLNGFLWVNSSCFGVNYGLHFLKSVLTANPKARDVSLFN